MLLPMLISCTTVEPIPETWPKRYQEFLQKTGMPIGQRSAIYLGLNVDKLQATRPYDEAIVLQPIARHAISGATIRFDSQINNIATGRMWTAFDASMICISRDQLKEVGEYVIAWPTMPIHSLGINGSFGSIRFETQPDHLIFKLKDDVRVEAIVEMHNGCLTGLKHAISSRINQ
jgi:hypothetical protein